jgi:RND family efflux transporter MFP subunit
MSRRRRLILIAAVLAAACRRGASPAAPETPRRLATAAVAERDIATSTEIEGTVVGRSDATLASRLAATVAEVTAVPGRRVRAGEVLVRLDARESDGALEGARAALASAEEAWKIARWNEGRFARLSDRGAAAPIELEHAVAGEAQARAQVAAATAAVRRAETDRSQAVLTAPFDGVVVEKMASPGDLALPGRPLVRLASVSGRRVEAAPGEEEAARLAVGDAIEVAIAGRSVSARLSEIVGSVDHETRRRPIRVDLPEGVEPAVGSFARVRLSGPAERRLVAPAGAVREQGGLSIVWTVDPAGRAELRYVRTGRTVGEWIEIRSGLSMGDRVVVEPPPDLASGARVAS